MIEQIKREAEQIRPAKPERAAAMDKVAECLAAGMAINDVIGILERVKAERAGSH